MHQLTILYNLNFSNLSNICFIYKINVNLTIVKETKKYLMSLKSSGSSNNLKPLLNLKSTYI